ncbi:type II secretion system protein GspM [Cellvibrio japonicus]|uniref:Type II secretion system protein M n=1 Tax=Cellvibrio japonicus (strain Ueda107) TaxID=498211 RepID=B3PEM1_CELJU|nr:type II secretion system protein M [Cellvibrio japonicus]ACE83545.1 General secretion pathway protein M [Cellvibrio japonicus Ueda107]QEI13572.1 type II secretion system protein M [Cellvibrio japonicus]QEI17146.1 type II secretion system protein M [Cellvibrio japonicus]QEI20723.1 type II secretion system protein M [Cellvibrio japonicus]
MNQLFAFLNRYQRREQIALLALGIAVVIFLLWILILAPLQKKREQLQTANTAATQTLGKVRIMAAQIQQARDQGGQARSGENISGLIDSSLRGNGLTMSGFQPGVAGEVRVRLDRAAYEPLMQWLYELEFKHGVSVRDLSLAATNDPGLVTVNLRLQKAQ